MEVINDLKQISNVYRNAAVTIGNFDGVHIGHQALFRKTIEKAHTLEGTSVVLTFEPHPLRILNPNRHFSLITLYEQKVELIRETGVDILVCVPFTQEFAATTAHSFVQNVLCDTIGMKAVIVGPDHTFGRSAEGNLASLREMGSIYGFEVVVSRWIEWGRRRISSTEIRKLVREGKMEQAAKLLGRHYQVRGTVIHGRHRGGKLLGFPTTNLRLHNELCPKKGVYAVMVECNGIGYQGVANIGCKPTFDDGEFGVETHILDFERQVYGQSIQVNFVRRLRSERRFPSPQALALQIRQDVREGREILLSHG